MTHNSKHFELSYRFFVTFFKIIDEVKATRLQPRHQRKCFAARESFQRDFCCVYSYCTAGVAVWRELQMKATKISSINHVYYFSLKQASKGLTNRSNDMAV
jgi:hypothetical protein